MSRPRGRWHNERSRKEGVRSNRTSRTPIVWSRVVQLARASAGKSGQFDRARLVRSISPVARLRGAASFRPDLDKLTELAKGYANLIPDDIGGTRLERTSLLEELDAKLTTARVVQVRGLPGSGKSVVVRRAVQRALKRGRRSYTKSPAFIALLKKMQVNGLTNATVDEKSKSEEF